MLKRSAKAYSSSYLQTVSLSPAIWSRFILKVCAAAENLVDLKSLSYQQRLK